MEYKQHETSIEITRSRGVMTVNNIEVNIALYDRNSKLYANDIYTEEECQEKLNKITPKEEYEKIWNTYDYFAINNACDKIKVDENIDDEIIIKSFKQFEQVIKNLGIYDIYVKEKQILDKRRKALEREDLIEVKFEKYWSWETGLNFLILKERVNKDIFKKLINSGLYYHKLDEAAAELEERFSGWCIRDEEDNILKLAENGIKVS